MSIICRLPYGSGGKKSLILPDNASIDIYSYDNKLVVKWTKPSNSEIGIAKYNLYWVQSNTKPTSLKQFTNKVEVSVSATEQTITNLTNGKIYWVALESVSTEGYENASLRKVNSMNAGSTKFLILKGTDFNNYSMDGSSWFGIIDENANLLYSEQYGNQNIAFGSWFYKNSFYFATLRSDNVHIYKIDDYKTCTEVAASSTALSVSGYQYNDVIFDNKNGNAFIIVGGSASDLYNCKQSYFKYNCNTNTLTEFDFTSFKIDGARPENTNGSSYRTLMVISSVRFINNLFFASIKYVAGDRQKEKLCYSSDFFNWTSFEIKTDTSNKLWAGHLPSIYIDGIYYSMSGYSYDFKTYVRLPNKAEGYVRKIKNWIVWQYAVNDGFEVFYWTTSPPTGSPGMQVMRSRDLISKTKNDLTLVEGSTKSISQDSGTGYVYRNCSSYLFSYAKVTNPSNINVIYKNGIIEKGSYYTSYCPNTEGECCGQTYGWYK